MSGRVVAAALAAALVAAGPAPAQHASPAGGGAGEAADAPAAGAVSRMTERRGPIEVDGRLSEEAWARAATITGFVQGEPVEGAAPEQRTVVRVLYDEDAIYVGARLYEEPGRIARQLVRRDETGQADYFEVSLDPNRDRRTGYRFRLTAAGVESDAYLYEDNREDESWDAVWESDVTVDPEGWTAELRIPWSQVRYESGERTQTWGVNFIRWRVAAGERTYYALVPRNRHGRVSFFRPLQGVRVPERTRRIEVRPYVLARARTGPAESADPFFDGADGGAQAGFDLRFGLGSAFTLDATVNPDFGQVELDPAVINLSAFETFFPERRPFFVEDARILDFDLSGHRNMLFYSRRIGREPQGSAPDDAEFVDVPDQSTILGAGKLTGRTSGGLSVGALAAVSAAEEGRAYLPGAPGDAVVAYPAQPRSHYGVLRVQQDLRQGSTAIGGIVTGVRRALPDDGAFDFLPRDAFTVGVDFDHMWGDREWAMEGFWAGSLVRGEPEALVRIQESSNHYFQRPDSDFRVDSSATSLAGAQWRLQFERRSGEHWTGAVWAAEVTPGFEINDLGYSRSSERLDGGARISYREIEPGPVLRSWAASLSTWHNWRHDALEDPFAFRSWGAAQKAGSVGLSARGLLNSFWGGSARVEYSPEVLDDGATRGGPLMLEPRRWEGQLRLHTDRREPVAVEAEAGYEEGRGGYAARAGVEVTLRAAEGWEIRLEPAASRSRRASQYVTSFDDGGFEPTFGRRYIFGELERTSVSLETRLNVTFSPALTLQLFAQPLLEAGDYTRYRQLARAESFEFIGFPTAVASDLDGDGVADRCAAGAICSLGDDRYIDFDGDGAVSGEDAFDDRDFNLISLRGNAVLRWEYQPGSTLFVVWQQRRSDYREYGDFDLGRDPGDLVGLDADNVFMLKLNYWLGV